MPRKKYSHSAFFKAVRAILSHRPFGKVISNIFQDEIQDLYRKISRRQQRSVLGYLRNAIPSYYHINERLAYREVTSDMFKLTCLEYKVEGKELVPDPKSYPTETNYRIMRVYKRILEVLAKRSLPRDTEWALGLFLPDPMTIFSASDPANYSSLYSRPKYFLAALFRAVVYMINQPTDVVWSDLEKAHGSKKATLLYINLILLQTKRLTWWTYRNDILVLFTQIYSNEANNWTDKECRAMTSAIYNTPRNYLLECLVNREANLSSGKAILMKLRPCYLSAWRQFVLGTVNTEFCQDISSMISEFLDMG